MSKSVTQRVLPVFRKLHRWVGLAMALPMMLQGATGAFLVAAPVVDQWRAPHLASAAAPAPAAPVIEAAMQAALGLTPVAYQAAQKTLPAAVDFANGPGRQASLRLWVDPGDDQVVGRDGNPNVVYHFVHGLHEMLLLPFGRNIIGAFGICLFLLTVTGALLWLPPPGRRLAGLAIPRKARGARLLRELHAVVAVWLLLPLAVQSVSGVSMAFPNTARALFGLPAMHRPMAQGNHPHSEGGKLPASLAELATQAEAASDGAMLVAMRAQGPGAAMAMLRPESGGTLRLMVNNGYIAVLSSPRQSSAVLDFLSQLHGTEIGGPVWQLVAFLMGISLPLLGVTGSLIWFTRKLRRVRGRVVAGQAGEVSRPIA